MNYLQVVQVFNRTPRWSVFGRRQHNDELKAIFSSTYPEEMPKPDHYWLPIVALFTGARREEIASLKASNVKKVDGVSCFLIEGGKTADARRVVPIHPQLETLGFMAYAQHLQSMGQELLFPYLVDGANGRGKNAGRQFAKLLDKRKIRDERKVFHSFRHTLITRLHATGANPAHVMQITGHRGETAQSVHFQTYTHDVGLKALDDTLRKLEYSLADSSTRCNKDEPGDGWLRMSRHHGHSNRQVQVARCTSTSAEKNDTKFTAF